MIVEELAYKVTLKADEFLNGKKKISTDVTAMKAGVERTTNELNTALSKSSAAFNTFGKAATSSFKGVIAGAAGLLGIGAGLYGLKQLFTSTSNEIVKASNQARFFGTNVNKMFGMQLGFREAGLNGDAFISGSGNARMALANIKDPTVFGGITGAAQSLLTLGARTGLNVQNLGDPNKALSEFTRYGKRHSQDNLMQVMSAAGFDPTDAAKIKSGELKSLVDSETKKSHITAKQVKAQEDMLVTLTSLDAEFGRIKQDLAIAFSPEVLSAMKAFGRWVKDHEGDIIGFFQSAGDSVKSFTTAVGGAENALKILAGMYLGSKVLGTGLAVRTALSGGGAAAGGLVLSGMLLPAAGIAGMLTPTNNTPSTNDELADIAMFAAMKSQPRNQRNNNPGNLNFSGQKDAVLEPWNPAWGDQDNRRFAKFNTEQAGWDAMSRQLMAYFTGNSSAAHFTKLKTVKDIISTYAPGTENDTAAYIADVAKQMGVKSDAELNLSAPEVMARLRTAMAKHEGYPNWKHGLHPEYYGSQQKLASLSSNAVASSVNNSQQSSTNIGTVIVKSEPTTVDALTKSISKQASRASTNSAFSSAVR